MEDDDIGWLDGIDEVSGGDDEHHRKLDLDTVRVLPDTGDISRTLR